jgi:hypothetical protein
MTDPRRQAWAGYVREVADRLRLRDWAVVVKDDGPEDGDAHASCHCVYGRKLALIRLSDGFLDDPPEGQRHSVVHELLHCHLDDGYWFAYGRMPNGEAKEAFERFVEKGIDGLADAIAPLMPLPGTPAGEARRAVNGAISAYCGPGDPMDRPDLERWR